MVTEPEAKGFKGLDSLVPDVEESLERAKTASVSDVRETPPTSSSHSDSTLDAARHSSTHTSSETGSTGARVESGPKTIVVIGAVIGGLVVLGWLSRSDNEKDRSNVPSAASRGDLSPAPRPRVEMPPSPPVTAPRQQAASPSATVASAARLVEEKPPAGTGLVLNSNQIRYCLFESVRLDTFKSHLNSYSQVEVDSFNEYVADYNSRCGNFRYRRGTLEPLQAEVQANRVRLIVEAAERLARLR